MIPIEERSQQSVMAQVLTWARIAPERVAVSAGGKHWTYAELTDRAMLLATTLREMGIRRGDVVAIMGPRSFGLIGSMLGVLMSGGAFLTIDPTLPTQRKRVMLREARTKVLCLIGPPGANDCHLAEDETLAVLRADLDLASLPKPRKVLIGTGRCPQSKETIRPTCFLHRAARVGRRQFSVATKGSVIS